MSRIGRRLVRVLGQWGVSGEGRGWKGMYLGEKGQAR